MLQNRQQTLEGILCDKELRLDFIFYVNKIFAQESLLFWMEVEIFKKITDSDECKKQAKLLYYRYLHPSSKSEVNVEGKLKAEVEKIISGGIWDATLFNHIQDSVHECLKYSVVKGFFESLEKEKSHESQPPTLLAHTVLERYDGVVQRAQIRESGLMLRNPLRWMHKKKPAEAPESRLDKSNYPRPSMTVRSSANKKTIKKSKDDAVLMDDLRTSELRTSESVEEIETPEKREGRKRLSRQDLQQQIQFLRSLHQLQQISGQKVAPMNNTTAAIKDSEMNMWESLSSSPLSKCSSLPVIAPPNT